MNEGDPPNDKSVTHDTSGRKRMTLGRQIKRLAILLGLTWALLCLVALTCTDRILFRPHASSYADGPEVLKLKTVDGLAISALYLGAPKAGLTILFSHGNGEDMGDCREDLQYLWRLGFSVLAYDYHGYGTSVGKPSEAACYIDIRAAYKYLTETLRVEPRRIIAYGRSVGSGPSVELASCEPLGGLILESAFTSAFRVSVLGYVVPGDRFRNIEKIHRVRCPLLVIHGTQDWIIPLRHARQLLAAANEPKRSLWVEGAGHNDLRLVAGPLYDQTLLSFARQVEQEARK